MAGDAALQAREFRRILLIKLSSVGDVVHALPVLVKLRQRYPAARIDWLVKPECADLVRCHPALSGFVGFPRRTAGGGWAQATRMTAAIRAVRRTRYELVVDL